MIMDMNYKMVYYLENRTESVPFMLNTKEMLHKVTLKEMYLKFYFVVVNAQSNTYKSLDEMKRYISVQTG